MGNVIGYLLSLVLVGLIVGAVARLLMPGPDPISIPVTILVGIGGSVLGGWLGSLLFSRPGGFILGVLCSMLILYVMRRSRAA
ncbi:MAG TPA: GlsB/YeaQ/YmgE family stress response membrane protein [Actinomycetota bacterium]|jgi:uncharacterized membrane protein YeaQ/YmgE (transglycosylase-associated protein family)